MTPRILSFILTNMNKYQVIKGTGEIEDFSEHKLKRTLIQAGADQELEQELVAEIEAAMKKQLTTQEIHQQVYQFLKHHDPASAARYNLRQAVMELGPTGFPFEQFVASLLANQGYTVETNKIVYGACVSHEVDIIAVKKNTRYMIECKYHNKRGSRSDIKTALYVWARFEDISEAWEKSKRVEEKIHEAWLVTNTKVSEDAENYAKCRGLVVVSWYRPFRNSLKDMIVQTGLWPITCLSSLDDEGKKTLVEHNLVLCKDLLKLEKKDMKKLKVSNLNEAIKEAGFICDLPVIEADTRE